MKLSCVACRQKKIKCDRNQPCQHCSRAGVKCVPQTRAKVTRRLKKPADTQVLERLKQLESIVSRLEGDNSSSSQSPPDPSPQHTQTGPSSTSSIADTFGPESFADGQQPPQPPVGEGRLVVKDGKTTYVTGGFWANLTNEIMDLIEVSNALGEDGVQSESSEGLTADDPNISSEEMASTTSPNFILGFTSDSMTLRMMHPTRDRILSIWEVYKENVAPINKSLHVPSVERIVLQAVQDIATLNHETEALMFGVYYLTVLTMTADETISRFGMERRQAMDRFRFATEQALARADFLLSQHITVLQTFHLYISALSRDIDDSSVPKLVILMVDIAKSMGLHRDGEQFNIPPFETEIRRRVWWTCRTLDMRASVDHDARSLTADSWSDTKLPLDVNDEDIWPGMTHYPQSQTEYTPMTFCLLRWELAAAFLRFGKMTTQGVPSESEILTYEETLRGIRQRIEDRYLSLCTAKSYDEDPLQFSSVIITDIIFARLWLVIYHPLIKESFQNETRLDVREKAFKTALDGVQKNRWLEKWVRGSPFAWLLKPILHWHAMVIILCQLCETPEYHEAWTVINEAFQAWSDNYVYTRSKFWKPLCRLHERAQRAQTLRVQTLRKPDATPMTTDNGDQNGFTTNLGAPPSFAAGDSMWHMPLGLTYTSYNQSSIAAPLDMSPGLSMPMDDILLPTEPLMGDGVPWDWASWDAIYSENP